MQVQTRGIHVVDVITKCKYVMTSIYRPYNTKQK